MTSILANSSPNPALNTNALNTSCRNTGEDSRPLVRNPSSRKPWPTSRPLSLPERLISNNILSFITLGPRRIFSLSAPNSSLNLLSPTVLNSKSTALTQSLTSPGLGSLFRSSRTVRSESSEVASIRTCTLRLTLPSNSSIKSKQLSKFPDSNVSDVIVSHPFHLI